MKTTALNPAQIQLLKMFEWNRSEEGLNELKDILFKYYNKKMNDSLNGLWDSGKLNQERLDEINKMDLHKLD